MANFISLLFGSIDVQLFFFFPLFSFLLVSFHGLVFLRHKFAHHSFNINNCIQLLQI